MDVVSICPLPVASLLWQPRAGSFSLTIVCKATFLLAQPTAQLASEQEEPNEEDNHWNDDSGRSLYSANDLSPRKARADVVLVGHAFAPARSKVRSLVTRLQVGTLDKAIEAFCDRAFRKDGTIDEGPPFARMPLVYERAAGGAETSNPVGMRVDTVDAYGRVSIPNLQPAGRRITSRADFSDPIGFGPIAPAWPLRREKLGRHAGSFSLGSLRTQPLPEILDPLYFNIAPPDQQLEEIRDRERLVLENLHPEHARLATQLPGIRPTAIVERTGRAPYPVVLRCDTLWIDTDRSRCTLVWRGQVPLDQPQEPGRVVVSMEEGTSPELEWPSDRRPSSEASSPRAASRDPDTLIPSVPAEGDLRGTGEFVHQPAPAVLPFAQAAAPKPREDRPGRVSGGLPFAPSSGPAPGPAPTPTPTPARSSDLPSGWGSQPKARPRPAEPGPVSPGSLLPGGHLPGGFASEPWAGTPPAYPPPPPVTPTPPPTAPALGGPPLGPPPGAPPPAPAPKAVVPPGPVIQAPALVPSASSAGAPVDNSPWASAARGAPVPGAAPATVGSVAALGAAAAAAGSVGSGSLLAPSVERSTLGTSAAASGTALSASNVAAGAGGAAARSGRPDAGPGRATPAWDAVRAPSTSRGTSDRDVVELLWYDPESVPRVRKKPSWRRIVDELEKKPPDTDLDDAAQAKEPMEVEDRREIFEILIKSEVTDPEGVNEAMNSGIRDDGKFVPPLVMVAGEVFFPFDELATLKVTVTTVTPLVGQDENLRSTVDVAKDFSKMPDLATAPAVSEGLTTRIKDAFGQGKRVVAPGYLEQQTERALLEGRHYQRREVFGGKHVRALLMIGATQNGIPTYIRDEIAKKLPMYQRFKARMICEVHMPADQYELHPNALRVMALGRVSTNPRGGYQQQQ